MVLICLGYQATEFVRKSPELARFQSLPIVALTANAYAADESLCREKGMNDFIPKPVNRAFLAKTIRKHMKNHY
jgi:CheY-like chemotaxis protein